MAHGPIRIPVGIRIYGTNRTLTVSKKRFSSPGGSPTDRQYLRQYTNEQLITPCVRILVEIDIVVCFIHRSCFANLLIEFTVSYVSCYCICVYVLVFAIWIDLYLSVQYTAILEPVGLAVPSPVAPRATGPTLVEAE